MVRMDWFISNLLGGVKLLVNSGDAEDAVTVLNQSIPENFDVQGIGEYQQPRCPSCQSLEVSFDELNKKIAYPRAWLGLPLPVHNRAWSCHSCGYHWKDTETGDIATLNSKDVQRCSTVKLSSNILTASSTSVLVMFSGGDRRITLP